LNYWVRQHDGEVNLWIGRPEEPENRHVFEALMGARAEIEAAFGTALNWKGATGRRSCVISYPIGIGGYGDEDKWPQVQEALIDAMVRLERALKPHIAKLPV